MLFCGGWLGGIIAEFTAIFACLLLSLSRRYSIRHFSHVTESRSFKNVNLSKKSDCNFRGTFLENRFSHLKLYSNPQSWLARSCCYMSTFWKTKYWSSFFDRANLAGFGTWKVSVKEDLNRQEQVFLHNFRPGIAQKPKIWSIFYGKKFI